GTPEEDSDVSGDSSTGAVSIWFGSDTDGGLNVEKHVWITPDNVLLQDGTNLGTLVVSESERSLFGHSLSAADFNDDGRTDLAIGIPNQPTTAALEAGAVAVIHGTSNLQLGRNQLWSQEGGVDDLNADLGDLRGSSFPGDDFGWGMYDSYHLF
ncbi:MAG: FG-GAP repeat protein, partial [Pseudomonadota bacterium]